jgi:hypothetical protein
MSGVAIGVDRWRRHREVSILITAGGVGRYFGSQPRAKVSMMTKRARAARISPAARSLRSDVVRRASHGGTLQCPEARRVAYRNVDKSYVSHRLS